MKRQTRNLRRSFSRRSNLFYKRTLSKILTLLEVQMSAIDDLNTAVGTMTKAVNDAVADLQAVAAALAAAVAANDPAAIEAAVQSLNTLAGTLEAAVAANHV